MKRFPWVLCAAAALFLGSDLFTSGAFAEPKKEGAKKAKKNKPKKDRKQGAPQQVSEISLEAMKKELNLTAEQETKLQTLWEERAKALSEWEATPAGQRLSQLRDELALASGSKRTSLLSQIRMLESQRELIEQRFDAKMLALLTAEQRAKWLGYQLYGDVCRRLQEKSVLLTTEQAEKVRALCNSAGKRLPATPTSSSMARMRSLLLREIFEEVLTDKQRKAIDPDYKAKGERRRSSDRRRNDRYSRGRRNRGQRINLRGGKAGKLQPLPKATPRE